MKHAVFTCLLFWKKIGSMHMVNDVTDIVAIPNSIQASTLNSNVRTYIPQANKYNS